jgi:hypothetical protein
VRVMWSGSEGWPGVRCRRRMWFGGKVSMISPRAEEYQLVKRVRAEEICFILFFFFPFGCSILAETFS